MNSLSFNRQIRNIEYAVLRTFFEQPKSVRHRQYEAVRAVVIDLIPVEVAAEKFGYKVSTLSSLLREAKAGRVELFPKTQRRPKSKKISPHTKQKIVRMRNDDMSAEEICKKLNERQITVSVRSVERVLNELGFGKLKRRTNAQLGKTRKNTLYPEAAENLNFSELESFSVDCPVVGVFFFLPYILESGILNSVTKCSLPQSNMIGAQQACLSMLLLKLIGQERLSHVKQYDREIGFGVFAGLNVLPKPTYMNTYSCLCSEQMMMDLQRELVGQLRKQYSHLYSSDIINLDFHSIPHFGDESEMEKVWCGARNKAMRGANTVFAQDGASNVIMYTKTDILRDEETEEVKRFVEYWKEVSGRLDETLVFDCKFTAYGIMDELAEDGIKFITLRKRHASLLKKTGEIPKEKWQRLYLPIPKRKRKHVRVFEELIRLNGCKHTLRQITIKDHGRANPTYVILNDSERTIKEVLIIYAKRWHVEQKLGEMVAFFNLNALSSPLMIRIHFDILWTLVADTLYRLVAADLRRFENCLAPTLFKKFIDMPGRITFDGSRFQIKIRKRAHTPVLLGVQKLRGPITVPWLGGRTVEVIWTP